jgi:hypothetical protein
MSVTWNSSKQSSQLPRRARRDVRSDRRPRSAGLHLLAHALQPLVHVGHELVEMRAPFAAYGARGEEQIHQHGLAAADIAVNVETADRTRLRRALGEQPAERRRLARQAVLRKSFLQPRELRGDQLLRAVALDLAFGDQGRVTFG